MLLAKKQDFPKVTVYCRQSLCRKLDDWPLDLLSNLAYESG